MPCQCGYPDGMSRLGRMIFPREYNGGHLKGSTVLVLNCDQDSMACCVFEAFLIGTTYSYEDRVLDTTKGISFGVVLSYHC